MFRSVGIVARYDKKQALNLAEELSKHLGRRGLEIFFEDTLEGKIGSQGKMIPLEKMKTDFLIAIGGDGTILRTCLTLPKPEPPILAINMGVRGFLTEVEPENALSAVNKILEGEFKIEKCPKLSVSTKNGVTPDALNDVVVSGGEPSKIVYLQIYKEGVPILNLEADGVIISTQTGSTGYSLSAGGPVLDAEIQAIVLTPICSLTTFRSMVFPANSVITIESIKPKEMLVLIDGNFRLLLPPESPSVTVTGSKNVTTFIRFGSNFYQRLESRFQFKGTDRE